MSRKIIVPSSVLFLVLVAMFTIAARFAIYVMNPTAIDDEAWRGSVFASFFVSLIVANVIAKAWPATESDGTNTGRTGFWGGFSIEFSSDGDGGADGGGDGGGGDGGGGVRGVSRAPERRFRHGVIRHGA